MGLFKVFFSAVNCWWPEGECRKRYKFLMYPVVMVYHTKLDGYKYTGKKNIDCASNLDVLYFEPLRENNDNVNKT